MAEGQQARREGHGRSPRHRCLACGRYRARGTVIRHTFLCRSCEERLVATCAGEPGYDEFIRSIRRVWPELRSLPPTR